MSDLDLDAIREDLKRASRTLTRLCNGQERWRMSIPAKPDSDPDLILAQGLKAADDAVAEVVRLRADLAERDQRIAAALAEHSLITNLYDDVDDCECCDMPWPCPTVRALSGRAADTEGRQK